MTTTAASASSSRRVSPAMPSGRGGFGSIFGEMPADDATATALDRLTGRRPGGLRAVAN